MVRSVVVDVMTNRQRRIPERRIASVPPQRIVYQESKRSMTGDELDKVVREAYEAAEEARREHYRMFRSL